MFKQLLTILTVCFTLSAEAGWDEWDDTEKKLFIASSIAITADWATTRNGAKHPVPNVYETNVFLGRRPTVSKVDNYFLFLLVSNYYITDWMPKEYRGWYLTFRTVGHGAAAIRNVELGWSMKF